MAEQSAISWTDATLPGKRIAPQVCDMRQVVAGLAQRNAILYVEAQFWPSCKVANVVRVEIAATVVAAVNARKSIAEKYLVAPALKLLRGTQAAPLYSLSVDVSGSIGTTRCSFASPKANQRPCFWRVLDTEARGSVHSRCPGRAHLRSTIRRHFRAFSHQPLGGAVYG